MADPQAPELTDAERAQRRRRNYAIAGALALWIVLIFAITVFRLGANVLDRPL